MEKIIKKIIIRKELEVLTGLHIGGSNDNIQIGGIDNAVIKAPTKDNQPYIPGSSIKGKIRCLLEQINGSTFGGNMDINNLFGFSNENKISKLIVRDAFLTKDSIQLLQNCDSLDMPYTENKSENVIDRITGTAGHPRQVERIPAGVKFNVEFIINIWDEDNEIELRNLLNKGISLIENDYLGGNGSRGYGQIQFNDISEEILEESNNWGA